MEKFYHGTCYLFNKFSPDFSGKGEGKAKYGRGIYVTSSYATAALYAAKAGKNNGLDKFYVYTVEIPDIKPDKHIFSLRPVNAAIVEKVEKAIGETIPDEVKTKRLSEIIELQNELSAESNRRDVGKEFEVLVEGVSKRSDKQLFGRTSQNKVVVFDRADYKPGDYVKVRVTAASSATLQGETI